METKKHKYFPGNYTNTCSICKTQISWCDKHCLMCESCYEDKVLKINHLLISDENGLLKVIKFINGRPFTMWYPDMETYLEYQKLSEEFGKKYEQWLLWGK